MVLGRGSQRGDHLQLLHGGSGDTFPAAALNSASLPQLDLTGIDACFSEDEIWSAIKELPSDRSPGPDGFTGLLYKSTWGIIKHDVINAFNALWSLDARSFNLLNDAVMILLRKRDAPTTLKDYRPISLMHSFSKLFAKCLARRLAPRLQEIVAPNQGAFIRAEVAPSTTISALYSLLADG